MRRARYVQGEFIVFRGIIPAYAGSTIKASPSKISRWDHPRVCGEHRDEHPGGGPRRGSSPRMRGARARARAGEADGGIIPAYAGSTETESGHSRASRDHPRVCGEHTRLDTSTDTVTGSSPRMRGARGEQAPDSYGPGIIPAYAGSTTSCARSRTGRWDHPRVCGEHVTLPLTIPSARGSSPRMRGARQ